MLGDAHTLWVKLIITGCLSNFKLNALNFLSIVSNSHGRMLPAVTCTGFYIFQLKNEYMSHNGGSGLRFSADQSKSFYSQQ